MIKINFDPQAWRDSSQPDAPLQADWKAPLLTVNGITYDLSELPDGAHATHPVLGRISRVGDAYECTLRLPHGPEQWLPTGVVSETIYIVNHHLYGDRTEALAYAMELPDDTPVEIVADHEYQRAAHQQRFPDPIEITTDGPVPVPQPDTKIERQPAGDVEAFRAEVWPEPNNGELEA